MADVPPPPFPLDGLPGAKIIEHGLRDLARETLSIPALLVCVAAPRLTELGFSVPPFADTIEEPDLQLYAFVGRDRPAGTHAAYNAWRERIDRFLRAAAAITSSRSARSPG